MKVLACEVGTYVTQDDLDMASQAAAKAEQARTCFTWGFYPISLGFNQLPFDAAIYMLPTNFLLHTTAAVGMKLQNQCQTLYIY